MPLILESQRLGGATHTGGSEVPLILEARRCHLYWRLGGATHTGVSVGGATHTGGSEVSLMEARRCHSYWRLGGATHTGGSEVPLMMESQPNISDLNSSYLSFFTSQSILKPFDLSLSLPLSLSLSPSPSLSLSLPPSPSLSLSLRITPELNKHSRCFSRPCLLL